MPKRKVPALGSSRDAIRLKEILKLLPGTKEVDKKRRAFVSTLNSGIFKGLPVSTQVMLLEEMLMACHRLLDVIGTYRRLRFPSTRRRIKSMYSDID